MRSVFDTVRYNNRLYKHHSHYSTKQGAQSEARRLRKAGYKVVIRKHKRPTYTLYGVYVHD